MNRQRNIEQARKILLHDNFKKLSPQQIQEVFQSLLTSGLTKDDIKNILTSSEIPSFSSALPTRKDVSYLESLPYNVFINLILTQGIEEKDLIHLCNSSPMINEYCNRSFKLEAGELIPAYVFYLILKKKGRILKPGQNPREYYKQIISNDYAFRKLNQRLRLFTELQHTIDDKDYSQFDLPRAATIYELLYDPDKGLLYGLLNPLKSTENGELLASVNYAFLVLINLRENIKITLLNSPQFAGIDIAEERIQKINKYLNGIKPTFVNFANLLNQTPEQLLSSTYFSMQTAYLMSFHEFRTRGLEYLKTILIKANEIFIYLINKIQESEKDIRELISSNWYKQIIKVNEELIEKENVFNEEDRQEIENIETQITENMTLSKEEINYILYLHQLVLSGELPVLTPFTEEVMIKY